MKPHVQRKDASAYDEKTDARIRKVVTKAFKDRQWMSSLPTVRELFGAVFDRFETPLSEGRRSMTLPELSPAEVEREFFFLKNLERPVTTVQGRKLTLWELLAEAESVVINRSPPSETLRAGNTAAFRLRIAQYIHVARITARKARM